MQKTVHTLDGKTIYVNVEKPIRYTDTKHPEPHLHVIYDLSKPIAEADIFIDNGQITLYADGLHFPISGETFLELLHPDWHFPKVFSREEVGTIYAELLTLYWQCREKAENDLADMQSSYEERMAGDDW